MRCRSWTVRYCIFVAHVYGMAYTDWAQNVKNGRGLPVLFECCGHINFQNYPDD